MTSPTLQPVLSLHNVTRVHRDGPTTVSALSNVSLEVYPGEFVAVMGPSGSGKSTLLHIAGALDTPTSGTVIIDGHDLKDMNSTQRAVIRRRHVGFVFQNYNLVDTLTVAENVALPLELDGTSRSEALSAAEEALDAIDLRETAHRFPAEISGGQRQRVAIARALVGTRRLILADEPTGALDTTTAEAVMSVIRARADGGAATVVVTHEPRFAAHADRVVYLRDGRLTEHGSVSTAAHTLAPSTPAPSPTPGTPHDAGMSSTGVAPREGGDIR